MGCSRNLSQQAAGWGEPGARFAPALKVELSVLEHSLWDLLGQPHPLGVWL